MGHVKRAQLTDYISGRLQEREKVQVEAHLDDCDDCFHLYLDAIDVWSPNIALADTFTLETVEKITSQSASFHVKPTHPSKSNGKSKTIVHYLVAAGLTILLMLSGAFQNILTISDQTVVNNNVSLTDQVMDKTMNWLDKLKGEIQR